MVTNGAHDAEVAARLARHGYFVLACRPHVAERAMAAFRFGALVFDEDVATLHRSLLGHAFAAQAREAPVLHYWRAYPGGIVAMVAEHAALRSSGPDARRYRA